MLGQVPADRNSGNNNWNRFTTTPRPGALSIAQLTASKHRRKLKTLAIMSSSTK